MGLAAELGSEGTLVGFQSKGWARAEAVAKPQGRSCGINARGLVIRPSKVCPVLLCCAAEDEFTDENLLERCLPFYPGRAPRVPFTTLFVPHSQAARRYGPLTYSGVGPTANLPVLDSQWWTRVQLDCHVVLACVLGESPSTDSQDALCKVVKASIERIIVLPVLSRGTLSGAQRMSRFTRSSCQRDAWVCAGLTGKDVRLLMGHGDMSANKLRKVVHIARHRDLAAFDPIAEAFKVGCTAGTLKRASCFEGTSFPACVAGSTVPLSLRDRLGADPRISRFSPVHPLPRVGLTRRGRFVAGAGPARDGPRRLGRPRGAARAPARRAPTHRRGQARMAQWAATTASFRSCRVVC